MNIKIRNITNVIAACRQSYEKHLGLQIKQKRMIVNHQCHQCDTMVRNSQCH